MSNEILAFMVMGVIAVIVIIAWCIRASMDKGHEGSEELPVLSETARKRQILASIERLERKQAEMSIKLDQIMETKPRKDKPKAVKKKTQKTTKTRKSTSRKRIS